MKARRSGFTIIELLVVITIIALLMAIIFPVLAMSRESARRTLCIQNMSQLCKAAQGYAIEKNGFPPLYGPIGRDNSGQFNVGWTVYLLPRIEKQDVYEAIMGKGVPGNAQQNYQSTIQVYICPSDPAETAGDISPLSYAANAGLQDVASGNRPPDWRANGVFHSADNRGQSWAPERVDMGFLQQNDGSRMTICLTENVNLLNWNTRTEPELAVVWVNGAPPIALNRDPAGANDYAHARPSSRHTAGFVVGFCDAHVQFMNEAVDYTVYARLMTPAGNLTQTPGSSTPGPLGNQGVKLTPADLDALQ